ncbi:hypothetical protein [Nonomuraea sp. NPDC048826]|uniref:hypothetical protein n=1 Tax=Nonomuraea sp. NPDC048826 TaxID=3364347 RepID=UPI0037125C8F
MLGSLDAARVERHCLDLARQLTEQAADLGYQRVVSGPPSQIVVLRTDHADRLSARLRAQGVRATALGDRVRFG